MANNNPVTFSGRNGHWVFVEGPSTSIPDNTPNEASNSSALQTVARHPKFFFEDVLVAIQIENTLFNVHKYQLTKSEVFSDMFKVPKPKGDGPEEGSSPEHPIVINGVAASDFEALLTVMYAGHFSSSHPAPEASLVIPAFRLANMFSFSELHAFLLPFAEKNLDDVDKIVFAMEFGIKEWLVPAHIRLCQREEPLNAEEVGKLQPDSVVLIWRMREQHRNRSSKLTVGHIYCEACAGLRSYGTSNYTCQHCNIQAYRNFVLCSSAGTMWENNPTTITNDIALEAEVKKWVEDNYVAKG